MIDGADGKKEHVLLATLMALLNAAFTSGSIPDEWNTRLITPIYKNACVSHGKLPPIAVGAPVLRLLATIINKRLMDFIEEQGLRSPIQAGFRPGKSCGHQLMALQHFIDQETQMQKGYLFCCFVDLKGAYDTVPRDLLWQTLTGLGLHGDMLACIRNMYANNSLAIKVGGMRDNFYQSHLGLNRDVRAVPPFSVCTWMVCMITCGRWSRHVGRVSVRDSACQRSCMQTTLCS